MSKMSFFRVKKRANNVLGNFPKHVDFLISIAEDNGDILYLDSLDNFSVWIYMHDSSESKHLENSFDLSFAEAAIG